MFTELNTLKPFFEAPSTEFNVREVARLLGINPATASKRLKELKKTGFLVYRKERMLDLYKAALDNEVYRDLKLYYNIRKIRESGLIKALNRFYIKPTLVLFGSASTGLDTISSDIDILVLSEKVKRFPETEKFSKKLGRLLQLFVVKNLTDLKNKHLINNVVNGKVIQGEIAWT